MDEQGLSITDVCIQLKHLSQRVIRLDFCGILLVVSVLMHVFSAFVYLYASDSLMTRGAM